MIQINKEALTERFMRYVQIDTQSDPESTSFPSTEKQRFKQSFICRIERNGFAKCRARCLWVCVCNHT
jgi:di/tripeptidase